MTVGSRGRYVDEDLLPQPAGYAATTWLDAQDAQQLLLDEFHREEQMERRGWELLDAAAGGWQTPSGRPTWRRSLLHDERWDRGDCGG